MRSPLVTPTRPQDPNKCQDPRPTNSNTSENHTEQQKAKSSSRRLAGILKKAVLPSKGLKRSTSSGQNRTRPDRMASSLITQMTPLLTPTSSPRPVNDSFTNSSDQEFTMSPLLHPHLYAKGVDSTMTSRSTSTSGSSDQFCSTSSSSHFYQTIPESTFPTSQESTSSMPGFINEELIEVEVESSEFPMHETHTSIRDYMKSGRPFPPDEHQRDLKIVVRTGIRDLRHLAEELNSKARISSLLNTDDADAKGNVKAHTDKDLGSKLKRWNSSSAKINYTECANSKRQIHRAVCSSTALPGETEAGSSSNIVAGSQEEAAETKVIRKRLFDQNAKNETLVAEQSHTKTSETSDKIEDVAKPVPRESKGMKLGKRLSLTLRNEGTDESSKISRNSKGRNSFDAKYATLHNIDTENELPKTGIAKKDENASKPEVKVAVDKKKIPRRIFKVLYENN